MVAPRPALWIPFAEEVMDRIVSGTYPPGLTIPTESQLGEEFGISRTVVREGVKILADKGLLRIQRGRGTEVQALQQWRAFDPAILAARLRHGDKQVVLREVLILRKAIEPELAAGAARDADERELEQLAECVEELNRADRHVDRYLRADAAFHDLIGDFSRISLGRDIVRTIAQPVQMQRMLTSMIPGNPQMAHQQHLAIYDSIRRRDADGARRAMREHLEWAELRLDRALEQDDD